jgi:hypothetical protein
MATIRAPVRWPERQVISKSVIGERDRLAPLVSGNPPNEVCHGLSIPTSSRVVTEPTDY